MSIRILHRLGTGAVPARARARHSAVTTNLPADALVKLPQIIGDVGSGTPGLLPVSKSALYGLIRAGRFPQPVKPFHGCRGSFWRLGDVRSAIEKLLAEASTGTTIPPLQHKRAAAKEGTPC